MYKYMRCFFYFLFFINGSSQAYDINITVNGRVVAKPCTIGTTDVNIDLGDLFSFSFISPGSSSSWNKFSLDLSNCPVGTSRVVATFSGTVDASGYYKNLGTAGNIQLELQDGNGSILNSGSQKSIVVDDSSQSVIFPLQVRVLSVNGNATQGTIKSVISVTYTYS